MEIERIRGNFQKGVKTKRDQEIQEDWGKIEKSSYCTQYKEIKSRIGRESKERGCKDKEQWARLRCGNVERI